MPNGALRFLAVAMVALSVLSGAGQTHDNGKPSPQPAQQPAGNDRAASPKLPAASRDVCEKHPNLKQCS
jgi:hypothetical protein